MANELENRHCKPCEGGVEPLRPEQSKQLLNALHADWKLSDDGREISRRFGFPAYSRTLGFANAVASSMNSVMLTRRSSAKPSTTRSTALRSSAV